MKTEIKITKEIENYLKEYGLVVESKSPLKLVGVYNDEICGDAEHILVGIPALIELDSIIKEFREDEGCDVDLSDYKDTDNLLVSISADYADEFDLNEWMVMTVGEYKNMAEKLNGYENEIEWYFGTNESLSYSDGEDLLSQLSIKKISQEEANVLNDLFDGSFDGGGGVFEHIFTLEDNEDDDDEDEDDDEGRFDSDDIRNINFLAQHGWTVEFVNEDSYNLKFTDSKGEVSVCNWSMLEDMAKYYKRKNN